MIAGRIPGRTANDVKNYWNTHQRKKTTDHKLNKHTKKIDNNDEKKIISKSSIIIKPHPRKVRNQLALMNQNFTGSTTTSLPVMNETNKNYSWELLNNNITEDDEILGFMDKAMSSTTGFAEDFDNHLHHQLLDSNED